MVTSQDPAGGGNPSPRQVLPMTGTEVQEANIRRFVKGRVPFVLVDSNSCSDSKVTPMGDPSGPVGAESEKVPFTFEIPSVKALGVLAT